MLESDSPQLQPNGDPDSFVGPANASKGAKTIQSHGDWTIAYDSTKEAILFTYPHRLKELCEYEKYIIGLFAAISVPAKFICVIQLDWAIHLQVS